MQDQNNGFKLDAKEFEGHTRASLEFIKEKLQLIDTKVDHFEKCVTGLKIKMAAIGGAVSLLVTLMTLLVKEMTAK